jgi:hypothetical protein
MAKRIRVLAGDTAGAMALVEADRSRATVPGMAMTTRANLLYRAASLLSLLGRKEEAVVMLRESLASGGSIDGDQPLLWFWAPLRDYPPFQELVKLKDEG